MASQGPRALKNLNIKILVVGGYPGSTPLGSTNLYHTRVHPPAHVRHAGTDCSYTYIRGVLGEPLGSRYHKGARNEARHPKEPQLQPGVLALKQLWRARLAVPSYTVKEHSDFSTNTGLRASIPQYSFLWREGWPQGLSPESKEHAFLD